MAVRLVALLRGINVGRANRVAMADLRRLLTELGYSDVAMHLQSGNAVFTAEPDAAERAAGDIEAALREATGISAAVVTRTAAELSAAIAADPFGDQAPDPAKHLLGFLAGAPAATAAAELDRLDTGSNLVHLDGRHVYLWCPNGVLDSPFASVAWEKVLGVPVTMRNWRTVTKLAELAAG